MTNTKPIHERARPPVRSSHVPPLAVVRMFLLASVSVAAAAYGLVRFYTHPRLPMVVMVPVNAEAADAGERDGEIPAPEIVTVP
jgi:hypothetical protein